MPKRNKNYFIIPRRQANEDGDGLVFMKGVDRKIRERGEGRESEYSEDDGY